MAEEYTFQKLRDMKVTGLREIAMKLQSPELEGHSTWHKDRLLPVLGQNRFALCALDEAAHDLWGKKLGQPVSETNFCFDVNRGRAQQTQ